MEIIIKRNNNNMVLVGAEGGLPGGGRGGQWGKRVIAGVGREGTEIGSFFRIFLFLLYYKGCKHLN